MPIVRLVTWFILTLFSNKEGHLLVALCFYLLTYLRLLTSGAVTAAAAGGIAGLARSWMWSF